MLESAAVQIDLIRNFCIIAHIDHGKSTLADRFLEITKTLSQREMAAQVLDQMDLEREKGITIKAQAVRMQYVAADDREYELNLIDTPGHVDFSYEVSRSLAACEGAILVVDASQGIQAQTLANVYLAMENDLTLIPVVNKIDLPNADPDAVAKELRDVLGLPEEDVLFASAKDGKGVVEILDAVIDRIPIPGGAVDGPTRALVFDSKYDPYKGAIAYVRVVDGEIRNDRRLRIMSNQRNIDPLEVGAFRPGLVALPVLTTGEVGYVATGLKNVKDCQVGDTLTGSDNPASTSLKGYQPAKPMVFAGLYPVEGDDYTLLRDALDRLSLNDASLHYEPETSAALGFGFRCGFLGLLHMEIIQERLEREYDLSLLTTAPSVEYEVTKTDGEEISVDNPSKLPASNFIEEMREPWTTITVLAPDRYIGAIMDLVTKRRGEFKRMEFLGSGPAVVGKESPDRESGGPSTRVLLEYDVPLAEILTDFYDGLKSRTQGYASLDYSFESYRPAKLVKVDILVNNQPVDALSIIIHKDGAYLQGKALIERLKELIPRQLFDVPLQAAIGSKVIARETIRALRKNVLAKCYGGDVSRKRKLLEKQAKGKKRMKRVGSVEIPQEAFMAVLSTSESR